MTNHLLATSGTFLSLSTKGYISLFPENAEKEAKSIRKHDDRFYRAKLQTIDLTYFSKDLIKTNTITNKKTGPQSDTVKVIVAWNKKYVSVWSSKNKAKALAARNSDYRLRCARIEIIEIPTSVYNSTIKGVVGLR